ncbi:APC family permease [Glutamicibacter sp. JL.03c]|uniref:APC family permease n=1 Tax=Glutamicibacter sp. JL.03c TaxID=2984842 RepID=UPI0021F7A935|nr:APC family permease [Glutamicibacter sp. JL.03c]UYQ77374.1 APC family permease [Glutamicibacter sp. JL.03c]
MAQAPSTALPATKAQPSGSLRGNLSVASIVFIVVAAASPLGVIGGPVPLGIASGNGAGFPFSFVIATLVLLLFSVGFTQMTRFVPHAGAFYAYIGAGLGRAVGLGAAFIALLAYLALEAGVFGLFGPGLGELVEAYGGPELPWWVWAAACFAVVAVLGYRNIELSGKLLAVLLIAEVAIVVALDAVVIFSGGGPEGFSRGIVTPAEIVSGAPGIGILFAILSFVGFEATAVFRDEAKDPDRTIPRATYISLIAIGVFYTVSSWVLISANGQSGIVAKASENSGTILQSTTEAYLGSVGGHIVQLLFVTSLFACILSFHNISSRYFFQLGVRQVLPASLGQAHPTLGSPAKASVLTSAVTGVLVLLAVVLQLEPINQFYTWLGGISSVGVVLLLTLTSIAVLAFFSRKQPGGPKWGRQVAPALGLAGLLGFLGIILVNLPSLVGEDGYGPFSIGVLALLVAGMVARVLLSKRREVLL